MTITTTSVIIFPFIFISLSELSLMDILTTPSLAKPKKDYFRTPGQVLSLITSLGFVSDLISHGGNRDTDLHASCIHVV